MLENLYGSIPDETRVVAQALHASASRESAHPDDRKLWSPENATYGHCDLFTDVIRKIWGKDASGHWNSEAHILVWWVYSDEEAFRQGVKKNKLTVHYSFEHPVYGEIDLSRTQFPDNTFLHPRPRPLSHIVPVGRSWDRTNEMTTRRDVFDTVFLETLSNFKFPAKITPELELFLSTLPS